MAREILIVYDKFELPDGEIVIGLYTGRKELKTQWRNTAIDDLKSQYEGKKIQVFGEGYQFQTNVLAVDITNSIADDKNVFLKLENNAYTKKIQLKDEVEVDL
jgi:hypothetical protein